MTASDERETLISGSESLKVALTDLIDRYPIQYDPMPLSIKRKPKNFVFVVKDKAVAESLKEDWRSWYLCVRPMLGPGSSIYAFSEDLDDFVCNGWRVIDTNKKHLRELVTKFFDRAEDIIRAGSPAPTVRSENPAPRREANPDTAGLDPAAVRDLLDRLKPLVEKTNSPPTEKYDAIKTIDTAILDPTDATAVADALEAARRVFEAYALELNAMCASLELIKRLI